MGGVGGCAKSFSGKTQLLLCLVEVELSCGWVGVLDLMHGLQNDGMLFFGKQPKFHFLLHICVPSILAYSQTAFNSDIKGVTRHSPGKSCKMSSSGEFRAS